MGKLYLSVAAGAGLLLALAASADAGGGRSGQISGQAFTPPGFGHVANSPAVTHGNWDTTTTPGIPRPPGWSQNTGWNTSLGAVPPGLAKCPPGLTSC
jgi:hypothetical protein